jgi:hypothetical protein
MKIALTATILAATLAAFAVAAPLLTSDAPAAAAATPSATATATVEPTATPVLGTYIDIEVVDDLNIDGVRQPNEPGLAGAPLHGGCGDALNNIPVTGSDGKARLRVSPYNGRVLECVTLEHHAGWLVTTASVLRFDFPFGEQHTALFLVHDLGPDVMEIWGEPILAGVPAPAASIALAAPYGACIERPADRQFPFPLLFIIGVDRPGCPAAGASVQLLLDGSPAGVVAYAAGRASRDLVAHGDSMRMYGHFITAARISGVDCAVIQPFNGILIPPGSVRVFVLSEEVRSGCGAPGRLVRFYRDGVPLDPMVPWRAGPFVYPDVPDFVPAQVIAPNTGGGGWRRNGSTPALVLVAMLMATGVCLVATGVSVRGRA